LGGVERAIWAWFLRPTDPYAGTMRKDLRVLVAHEQEACRRWLAIDLAASAHVSIAGCVPADLSLIGLAATMRPDVIVLSATHEKGFGILGLLIERNPWARVIVVSAHPSGREAFDALRCGARGYAPIDAPAMDIVDMVRSAYRGEPSVHHSVAAGFARETLEHAAGLVQEPNNGLTERETAVLTLVAMGLPAMIMAERVSLFRRPPGAILASACIRLSLLGRAASTAAYDRRHLRAS